MRFLIKKTPDRFIKSVNDEITSILNRMEPGKGMGPVVGGREYGKRLHLFSERPRIREKGWPSLQNRFWKNTNVRGCFVSRNRKCENSIFSLPKWLG